MVREEGSQIDEHEQLKRLRRLKIDPEQVQPQPWARAAGIHPDKKGERDEQQSKRQPDVLVLLEHSNEIPDGHPRNDQRRSCQEPQHLFCAERGGEPPDRQQSPTCQCADQGNERRVMPGEEFVCSDLQTCHPGCPPQEWEQVAQLHLQIAGMRAHSRRQSQRESVKRDKKTNQP